MHIDPRTAPVVARVRGLSDVRAEWAGVRQLEAALVKDKETQQLAGLVPLEGLLVLGLLVLGLEGLSFPFYPL